MIYTNNKPTSVLLKNNNLIMYKVNFSNWRVDVVVMEDNTNHLKQWHSQYYNFG